MNRDDYSAVGYQLLPIRMEMEDVVRMREALAEWRTEDKNTSNAYGILHHNIYKEVPLFEMMMEKYKLGQLACELLDIPEIVLFQDNLVWKPPQTLKKVQWHQD